MYFPLQLRLTLFYAVLLGLALWFFGNTVYTQAEQRAYTDLDTTLSSRAASVSLGKGLLSGQYKAALPNLLQSVDELGSGGGAIEVLDNNLNLLATTASKANDALQISVGGAGTTPVLWEGQASHRVLR